jgi:minor curlin subunit
VALAQSIETEEVILQQVDKNAQKLLISELSAGDIAALQSKQVSGNYSNVVQQGNANSVMLQQIGMGNVTEVTQHGNKNTYEGTIIGNNNLNAISQHGNGNYIQQHILADDLSRSVIQIGNQNSIIQKEDGSNPLPYKIEQVGNGMHITITNGRVD